MEGESKNPKAENRRSTSGEMLRSPTEMTLMIHNGPPSRRPSGIFIQIPDLNQGSETSEDGQVAGQMPNLQEMLQMIQLTSSEGPLANIKTEGKSNNNPPGISMPGISTIFGDTSLSRRIAWIIVVAVVLSVATIQVKDRVEYYVSTPVTVNVRVTMNESLRFPALTLCNKNLFNVSRIRRLIDWMRADEVDLNDGRSGSQTVRTTTSASAERLTTLWDVRQLIGFRGMDIRQVWDAVAHDIDQIVIECWFGRNISCNQVGEWKTVYTYMGKCYSFVRSDSFVHTTGMFNNLYVKLRESQEEFYEKGENGWKILIHDVRDSPVIDIRTHGSTLDNGWGKDIRIYLREFQTLNTWKRPCVKEANYSKCIERCFIRAAQLSNLTCRLPFIDIDGLEFCSTVESYVKSVEVVEGLLFHGRWSTSNCSNKCPRQCDQDLYVSYTEMTQMSKSSDKRISKLRLFYQDFTFDEIQETADYGAVSLLCDIGGSLGFLLGFSVLTVFEIVDAIVQACLTSTRHLIGKCALIGKK